MKSRIIYSTLLACGLCFGACSDEELTPNIDITPEYDYLLNLTPESTHADTVIADWYKKYNCAVLYDFEEKDFRWLWSGQIINYYELLDISQKEDSLALEKMVGYIDKYLVSSTDDAALSRILPFRIYLTKEYHDKSEESSAYVNAFYNEQDALVVGYLSDEDTPYDEATFEVSLIGMYNKFSFNALDPKPRKFIESREKCRADMVILPENAAIQEEEEWNNPPAFVPRDEETGEVDPFDTYRHEACVLGYVTSVGKTPTGVPDEATDFGDYLTFITKQPGSYIRERTQFYWRMAKRGGLLIDYYKEYKGEDLIATQNANFPDDKVTLEDFNYDESRDE